MCDPYLYAPRREKQKQQKKTPISPRHSARPKGPGGGGDLKKEPGSALLIKSQKKDSDNPTLFCAPSLPSVDLGEGDALEAVELPEGALELPDGRGAGHDDLPLLRRPWGGDEGRGEKGPEG